MKYEKIDTKTGWPIVNLVENLEQIIDNRGKTPAKSDSGIPALSAKSVKMGKIEYEKVYFVSEETYEKFMVRGLPKVGDVLLTTEAPLGCVARLDRDDVCLAQRLITLRGKEGVLDNDYLRLYLSSSIGQHELISRASGSTVQGIKRTEFSKIDIILPPFEKQLEISKIIRAIEDKIELNGQVNQTLEHIAQALFKSWFVGFEPTRAKIAAKQAWTQSQQAENDGESDTALFANITEADFIERAAMAAISGKPVAELEHLPLATQTQLKDTAALFPDMLVDSELGEIPEGWDIKPLSKDVEIKHGYAFKSEYFSDEITSNILLTPGNFKVGGGFKFNKLKYYDGPIPEDYVLERHDLLITMTDLSKKSDTLGLPALVSEVGNYKFLHNQRLGRVIGKNGDLKKYFMYFLLQSHRYRSEIVGSATGTTVKHTAPKRVLAFNHPFQGDLENVFDGLVCSMYSRIENNINNSEVLTQLRDTLLPKLLSNGQEQVDAN
ncbi:restriction endonuclease subunit S [Moritella viscosa]|uniref:restriction endonuclease subunit S n=1 Tax=Moritella viscosa TaxID=80854 RepID=UPI0009178154|nr:restriction endonuclease subunit S [Moritella viscosa]SGZ03986.1 Type I restriction-modification system restriction subunit [Moritella viscosa]